MAGVLYQRQHDPNNPVFIGAVGRKCTKYEKHYHSSIGELAALNYALEKYKYLLLQGPFLVRTDNTTWEMKRCIFSITSYVDRTKSKGLKNILV